MESFMQLFKTGVFLGIPLPLLTSAFLVIIFSLLLKKIFSHVLIKHVKRLTEKTETQFDELLLHTIEGPLQLFIAGVGFYVARIILAEYLNPLEKMITQGFQLFFVIVICFLLYRGTGLLVFYLEKIAKRTSTELDDLLLPYLKKIIKIILIIIVGIKFAEIFLGMTTAAILGLLGGMGLTLGLVFKDIIANWFGCAIIYLDQLFNEGDWVSLDEGKIIDASFVEVPRQRNTREENKHIKETGTAPKEWDIKPNKKRQKDIDARWTKKNFQNYYGYKDHIKMDNKHKFIDTFLVTSASVHDSQPLDDLLDEEKDKNKDLWADSAYTGEEQDKTIKKYQMNNHVHEKGTRGNPLTQEQKDSNKKKSKTRVRVEHVFGFIEGSMNKFYLNCIGIKRASATIGLINLTYNLFRYEQLVRLHGTTMSNY